MKQITFLLLTIFAVFSITSCEKAIIEEDGQSSKSTKKTRIVSLCIDEEVISTSEMPIATGENITRAEGITLSDGNTIRTGAIAHIRGNVSQIEGTTRSEGITRSESKIYAINVYQKKRGAKSYSKFAYGLFNDPSAISLTLTEGYVYKFECLVATNGEDCIYQSNGEYLAPFLHGSSNTPTRIENKFIKSSKENMQGIVRGDTNIGANKTTMYPRLTKSFGVVEDFDPTAEAVVTMQTKRAVFGLQFHIVPPEEGHLELTYLYNTLIIKSTEPIYEHTSTFSFNNIPKAAMEGYSGDVVLELKWKLADGTIKTYNKTITLKRNVCTKINIEVKKPTPNKFQINEETGELTQEVVDWVI